MRVFQYHIDTINKIKKSTIFSYRSSTYLCLEKPKYNNDYTVDIRVMIISGSDILMKVKKISGIIVTMNFYVKFIKIIEE